MMDVICIVDSGDGGDACFVIDAWWALVIDGWVDG